MGRLIDSEEVKSIASSYLINPYEIISVGAVVDKAETIDPVYAAGGCYCKECAFRDTFDCPAAPRGWTIKYIDFCGFGVREDPEAEKGES